MAQGGVEGGLDVADLAGGLGQEQAALQGVQEPRGELRGVGVGAQVAAVARRLQAAAEQGLPLGEAGGEVGAGLRVGPGQLPGQGAEAAAAIAAQLPLAGDVQSAHRSSATTRTGAARMPRPAGCRGWRHVGAREVLLCGRSRLLRDLRGFERR